LPAEAGSGASVPSEWVPAWGWAGLPAWLAQPGPVSELREPARYVAATEEPELEPELELESHPRPRVAVVTEPSSPVPAVWQVQPVASEQQAVLPQAGEAVSDAMAVRPKVAEHAEVPRLAVAVAARAEQVEAVRRQEAPDVPAALLSALPWAVAWAFHQDPPPLLPVQRPAVWSARAMRRPRTAGL
jgi:hypothetical protein